MRLEDRGAAHRLSAGIDALIGGLVLGGHELTFETQHSDENEEDSSHAQIVPEMWEDPIRMRLVEEHVGVGDLSGRGEGLKHVRYKIARYQAFSGNGMPIPGRHRIEGAIDLPENEDVADLVGAPLVLRLEDGRSIAVTLADASGRVLSEGHGPTRCLCC